MTCCSMCLRGLQLVLIIAIVGLSLGCQPAASKPKTELANTATTTTLSDQQPARKVNYAVDEDEGLFRIVDDCLISLEKLSGQDNGIVVADQTTIRTVRDTVLLKNAANTLSQALHDGRDNSLPYDEIPSARELIKEKWVSLRWVSGERLLGKLQEHLGRSSGYYMLGLSENVKTHLDENHHLVCGVVLHEVKHLDQLLVAVISGELDKDNYLSDERIAEFEKEAYALEDSFLRLWGLTRQEWKLAKPPSDAIATMHLIINEWPNDDRLKAALQVFARALPTLAIVDTESVAGNSVFNFEYADAPTSTTPRLLLNAKVFLNLSGAEQQDVLGQMADDWQSLR